jgi:hypothetical protein
MEDIRKKAQEVEERWDQVREKNETLGDGLKEGKVVTFSVADGKAAYEIIEIGEKISVVKYRDDLTLDNYEADAVDHSTGEVLTANLEEQIKRQDALRGQFG